MRHGPREEWWREFDAWLVQRPDDERVADRIRVEFERAPLEARSAFLGRAWAELLGEHCRFGAALYLLQTVSDPASLEDLAAALRPLPDLQGDDEEAHLADLIRLLAASGAPHVLDVVRDYLLEREIGSGWPTVPWVLWPRRRDLFVRACARFLGEVPPDRWHDAAFVQAFLSSPRAVLRVRERLEPGNPESWNALRAALDREARDAGWLSSRQRSELDRVTR